DSEASARPSDPPLFLIGVLTLSALIAATAWILGARRKNAQARRETLLSRLHSGIPGDPGRSWKTFMDFLENDGDPEALGAEELHALLSSQKGPLLKLRVSDAKAVAVAGLFSKDGREEEAMAIVAARLRSILLGPQAAQLLAFDIYERGGRAQDFIFKARAGAGPRARHALLAILNKRGKPELAYSLLRSDGAQDDPGLLLDIANSFSRANKIQAALDLLKDPVLAHAARTPAGCDKALDILERALKLKEFAASGAGKPPEFLSAFARAFERRGMPEKALALLQASAARDAEDQAFTAELLVSLGRPDEALVTLARRPRREWSDAAYLLCFRLHIDLGELEKARELYGPVRIRKPPRDAPDLYYAFGLLCEKRGESDLAVDVYARLAEPPISHEKAAQRLLLLRSPLAAPRPAAQPPGLLGGKYELRASLAEGGMGKVYEGHDHALGRKVAVKKLHTELKSSPKERERFLQEARIVAGLSHPFIVGVHEIVEADGEVYLVFDFIDGKSLSALLQERGRLPLEECRSILKQVCLAVDFAHKKKVLHRDLKPSNIMVGKDGFARVLDFGLARTAKDSVSSLTRRGLSGTLAYLAPEQHLGLSHRASDIYALGVTLYEMLTGELPFQGPDLLKLKEAGLFVPLSAKDPSLPQSLDALMASALEPDHAKRLYRSIEFLQRLNA
ncbi:MAG: serine/threonine-protein kinase, partial [Elusimicrobiota bacterium]